MAIAAWKRLEKTPGYQRRKLFFKRLLGKELRLAPEIDIRLSREGGWWFHPDILDEQSVVYSLGVGDDIDFDLALVRRFSLKVHAFDPTPSTIEWLAAQRTPAQFHFHPWAVGAEDGELEFYPRARSGSGQSTAMYSLVRGEASPDDAIVVPAFCLASILAKLGHRRIEVLKMDIEGAEYEVLDSLLNSEVKPMQLLVEFHHRFAGIGLGKTAGMIERLRGQGYRIFAVSETGREVSFIRTASGEQRA